MTDESSERPLVPCTTRDVAMYFLRLGATGFGGPVALAGYMQRDLVEERRWFSKQEYLDGLALAQLAPGPLAAQLAIYFGWARGGAWGATVVGLAFVLPSFLMVLVLAALYVRFEGLTWMRGAFYGIGAAVIALMVRSVHKLAKLSLAKDRVLWGIAGVSALVTAWTESEMLAVFVAGGAIAMIAQRVRDRAPPAAAMLVWAPDWLLAGLAGPASGSTLWNLAWYFTEAGAFVFGSGLAIVPFLRTGVVERFGWLDDQQFLDAVAVAMITPGPVVITVAFIGFLVAGLGGAVVAALATFLPCWFFTVLPAPHYQRFARNTTLRAFVLGVTAAATGAIAGATFVLGRRAIGDPWTIVIALATLAVITRFKKVNEPMVIVATGVLGIALRALWPA
ncbi:chromate transporter [Sandaracinus amylolyticus]|nr:chromate transporter [Sandaracinus amylolyticus]